ncbi:MAG: outer membrane beta-barrel protein [Pseudomonadota bacterium]
MKNKLYAVWSLNCLIMMLLYCGNSWADTNTDANTLVPRPPGLFTLTPGGGYFWFSGKQKLDNTAVGVISLGYNATKHWTTELSGGLFETKRKDISSNDNSYFYSIGNLYYFRVEKRLQPYLIGGFGVTHIKNPANNDPRSLANISGGGGLELQMDRRTALRAEVKDVYTFTGSKQDVLVTLGMSFFIGGHSSNSKKSQNRST